MSGDMSRFVSGIGAAVGVGVGLDVDPPPRYFSDMEAISGDKGVGRAFTRIEMARFPVKVGATSALLRMPSTVFSGAASVIVT